MIFGYMGLNSMHVSIIVMKFTAGLPRDLYEKY